MATSPTANFDSFLEYAGRSSDATWKVKDFDDAVTKFRFPDRQPVDGNDQPFECNGELYRWVWSYTLPQHPLCRAYMDAHRKHKEDTLSDLMPVQIWAVSEFADIWSPEDANRAVEHLEMHGCPFHARIVCAPVGHSPPILGIPHGVEARGEPRRGLPNRSYRAASSSCCSDRHGAA